MSFLLPMYNTVPRGSHIESLKKKSWVEVRVIFIYSKVAPTMLLLAKTIHQQGTCQSEELFLFPNSLARTQSNGGLLPP